MEDEELRARLQSISDLIMGMAAAQAFIFRHALGEELRAAAIAWVEGASQPGLRKPTRAVLEMFGAALRSEEIPHDILPNTEVLR